MNLSQIKLTPAPKAPVQLAPSSHGPRARAPANAFGCPRNFLDNRFVYLAVSSRAHGLTIGVNMNPDKRCNFNCVYCEVDRRVPPTEKLLDAEVMSAELVHTLDLVHSGRIRAHPNFAGLSPELLKLRHVTLSGDGEPTLCPNFAEVIQEIVHVRALCRLPFFKLVILTNGTGLELSQVQAGLKLLVKQDEIWIKLETGTQAGFGAVNRPEAGITLDSLIRTILHFARHRPVVIQSLFPIIAGRPTSAEEVAQFALRLKALRCAGAQISLVQIYSATRPIAGHACGHLRLRDLSQIAQVVRQETGLRVEVF